MSRGYNVTCHRRWIPQLDPELGFYNKNIKARTSTEPKMYEDIPLTIRDYVQLDDQNP